MKLLGSPPRSSFYRWKQGKEAALSQDTLERVSYILGIYSALQVLLPRPDAADSWIRKPNTAPLFGGGSALDRMMSGQVGDLFLVRQYLDAQRGGWA
jgi:Antitoxin Xre/MbcA/ParS C-terminal toxin-binding domain